MESNHCHESRLHFPWVAEGDRDLRGSALIKITDWLGSLPQDLIEVKPSHNILDLKDDPSIAQFFILYFYQHVPSPITLVIYWKKPSMKLLWKSIRTSCWLQSSDWSHSLVVMIGNIGSTMMNLHCAVLLFSIWLHVKIKHLIMFLKRLLQCLC